MSVIKLNVPTVTGKISTKSYKKFELVIKNNGEANCYFVF